MEEAWVSFNIFLPTGLGQIDKILSIFTHGKCIRGVGDAELFYPYVTLIVLRCIYTVGQEPRSHGVQGVN